jgi:hypothetical protein
MARFGLAGALLLALAGDLQAQVRDTILQVFPDTLVARPAADSTHRVTRLCAAGDVTLGTNLDSLWARAASANMWRRYGRYDHPDSLLSPLHGLSPMPTS